jgi:hypothetical protein
MGQQTTISADNTFKKQEPRGQLSEKSKAPENKMQSETVLIVLDTKQFN